MKTAAVICEYNPFHYGHKYQLEKTREAGATHIAAIMSGNFTQRGDVAVFDKYERAQIALQNGADLVLELPTVYSLSAAEGFARGAVQIAEALGCVDMLSFGSECGDISALKEAAGASEFALHTDEFQMYMRKGESFPSALAKTVQDYYTADVCDILSSPNNTLAVEYIKALDDIGSSIEPFTVARNGADHDSDDENSGFASASLIRKKILAGEDYSALAPVIDAPSADIKRLETAILAKLRTMRPSDFESIYDAAQGLGDRLYKAIRRAGSLEELYFLTKTKRYTLARVRRAVLCSFLGIDKRQLQEPLAYIRILGMNSRGREILSAAQCGLPIDTSLRNLMKQSREAHRQGAFEERCGDVYSLAFEKPRPCGHEFTAKPVILE
ncbi:MAG: nucleotidyltransferase family protein [Oscillospiraceae bacterium]|nr:nucleotidyltransferase family protein [Oscillospiraceae bacterium]